MVNDDMLSAVLSDFARRLVADASVQTILDHVVERLVDVLPVTSAVITVRSDVKAPQHIAASDEAALRYEQLQTQIGDGPSVRAYKTGKAVSVADLAGEERFPTFGPIARDAGLAAVFAFPLRHGDVRLGALGLYRDVPGRLDVGDMVAAQTLADVAAAYIVNAQSREDARLASDRYQHLALHDPLTGLPNRVLFNERLRHAAQRARRSHTDTAILFADIDQFKRVNDMYGHHIGDELLVSIAHRLSALIRSGDTLARFAGDEFVFLCEDLRDAGDAELLADRIRTTFTAPFDLSGQRLRIAASVGVAYAGPGHEVSNQLLIEADEAMYRVKRRRGPKSLTPPTEMVDLGDDEQLELDLRVAAAANELEVMYQPIISLATRRIVGVEALLRWRHSSRGDIDPLTIIDIAERSDLINDIGGWVLRRACADYCQWTTRHPDLSLDLAVNVSARQIAGHRLTEAVRSVLASTDMPPGSLVLEMTETVAIDDTSHADSTLTDLAQLGVRLALDDFGSGYSALHYLDRLPIHIIKIDQHFVARLTGEVSDTTIIAGITDMAHKLGMTVVAEGVETRTQHDHLIAAGCDRAQGHFYAHAMTAASLASHLGDAVTVRHPLERAGGRARRSAPTAVATPETTAERVLNES